MSRRTGPKKRCCKNCNGRRMIQRMSKKKRIKLSDQVRRAVDDAGVSRESIRRAAGIDKGHFSRFMSGERGLPMKTLDRLADHLGLDITTGKDGGHGKP